MKAAATRARDAKWARHRFRARSPGTRSRPLQWPSQFGTRKFGKGPFPHQLERLENRRGLGTLEHALGQEERIGVSPVAGLLCHLVPYPPIHPIVPSGAPAAAPIDDDRHAVAPAMTWADDQRPTLHLPGREVIASHRADRSLRQQAPPAVGAFAQQQPREGKEVVGRRDEAGVALFKGWRAAPAAGLCGIEELELTILWLVGGNKQVELFGRHEEAGVSHAERREDPLLAERRRRAGQRHARRARPGCPSRSCTSRATARLREERQGGEAAQPFLGVVGHRRGTGVREEPTMPRSAIACWIGSVPGAARMRPQPSRKVSRSSTVIGRRAGTVSSTGPSIRRSTRRSASSGSSRSTGSSRRSRPWSTSIITAAAVIGLLAIEAMRKIEVALHRRPILGDPADRNDPDLIALRHQPDEARGEAPLHRVGQVSLERGEPASSVVAPSSSKDRASRQR